MIVSIVRFRSKLGDDDVQRMFEERAERYRSVPGLVEKLYLRFPETGEWGAVYVWESTEDLRRFRDSDLGRTISTAYQVEGAAGFELGEVRLVVQPNQVMASG